MRQLCQNTLTKIIWLAYNSRKGCNAFSAELITLDILQACDTGALGYTMHQNFKHAMHTEGMCSEHCECWQMQVNKLKNKEQLVLQISSIPYSIAGSVHFAKFCFCSILQCSNPWNVQVIGWADSCTTLVYSSWHHLLHLSKTLHSEKAERLNTFQKQWEGF